MLKVLHLTIVCVHPVSVVHWGDFLKKQISPGIFLSIKNSTGVGKFNLFFVGVRTQLLFLNFTLLQDFPWGSPD